jgi:hypothetical protein
MEYAISTFCYGERYYTQTNRMIESFDYMEVKPQIFIVTDNVDALVKRDFVNVKNISEYNSKYTTYDKNYYGFDFSVKRYSLLYAFENGYENVILCDTDVVVNNTLYSHVLINKSFEENSIIGPVTYNFTHEVNTNSMLGRRLLHYEKRFGVEYEKNLLDFMPEDCIQYVSIKGDARFSFINTWDECIKIKDTDGLHNTPAGNIDEMCFSAFYNNIKVGNNAFKSLNLLIAKHDKWY